MTACLRDRSLTPCELKRQLHSHFMAMSAQDQYICHQLTSWSLVLISDLNWPSIGDWCLIITTYYLSKLTTLGGTEPHIRKFVVNPINIVNSELAAFCSHD